MGPGEGRFMGSTRDTSARSVCAGKDSGGQSGGVYVNDISREGDGRCKVGVAKSERRLDNRLGTSFTRVHDQYGLTEYHRNGRLGCLVQIPCDNRYGTGAL